MEVGSETLKPPYWFQVPVRPNGNIVGFVADINPGSIGMNDLQPWVLGSQSAS